MTFAIRVVCISTYPYGFCSWPRYPLTSTKHRRGPRKCFSKNYFFHVTKPVLRNAPWREIRRPSAIYFLYTRSVSCTELYHVFVSFMLLCTFGGAFFVARIERLTDSSDSFRQVEKKKLLLLFDVDPRRAFVKRNGTDVFREDVEAMSSFDQLIRLDR